jgi:hypothetical protein
LIATNPRSLKRNPDAPIVIPVEEFDLAEVRWATMDAKEREDTHDQRLWEDFFRKNMKDDSIQLSELADETVKGVDVEL